MNHNQLQATYFNFGFAGKSSHHSPDESSFDFPTGSNRRYLYFVSMLFGANVTNQLDGSDLPIVIVPNFRTNPQTGEAWYWLPVEGYSPSETDEIPRKSDPSTWPPFWANEGITQWPTILPGLDVDAEEFYAKFDDRAYTRYLDDRYQPVADEPSRGGIGIEVEMRIVAVNEDGLENTHIIIYDYTNISDFDIEEAAVTLWITDWVGTPENDDSYYDPITNTVFFTDIMPTQSPPEFDGEFLGVAAIRPLHTPDMPMEGFEPGDVSLLSGFQNLAAGGFVGSSDAAIWENIMTPGQFPPGPPPTMDTDQFLTFSFFDLPKGETRRLAFAVSVAQTDTPTNAADIQAVTEQLDEARDFWLLANGFPVNTPDDGRSELPQMAVLHQNYPNPFNPTTNIRYSLPHDGEVTLSVYNILGQRVALLQNGPMSAGTHEIRFNAENLSSGLYVYKLQYSDQTLTQVMTFIK